MTQRTRHSIERHYELIEEKDDKGKVITSHVQKREKPLDPLPREKWICPVCDYVYYVSTGQRINCKHDHDSK